MSARDDLADLLAAADANYWDKSTAEPNWQQIADAVISAGWRPPTRVIHHPVELMNLRPGSVVIDETDGKVYQPNMTPMSAHFALVDHGSFTVLWEPGDDDE